MPKPKARAKDKPRPIAGTKGHVSYETGLKLENRVAKWLSSQFGYEVHTRDLAHAKDVKRPHDVDVHAAKPELFGHWSKCHLWVECKAYKVVRDHVRKLLDDARDSRSAYDDGFEKWKASMLMVVSSKGFDIDAISLANKHKVYCVHADKAFMFEGDMKKPDFEQMNHSQY